MALENPIGSKRRIFHSTYYQPNERSELFHPTAEFPPRSVSMTMNGWGLTPYSMVKGGSFTDHPWYPAMYSNDVSIPFIIFGSVRAS